MCGTTIITTAKKEAVLVINNFLAYTGITQIYLRTSPVKVLPNLSECSAPFYCALKQINIRADQHPARTGTVCNHES